jgi:hypothetical protein
MLKTCFQIRQNLADEKKTERDADPADTMNNTSKRSREDYRRSGCA